MIQGLHHVIGVYRWIVLILGFTEKHCQVNVKGQRRTQIQQYKYLGTTVENTGQCKTEVANRINQAKIAFWEKATILRSNISMKTRIRILMCYVFSVVAYGCD